MNGVDFSQLLALDKVLIQTSQSWVEMLVSFGVTIILAMAIYAIYRKTYSGVLYVQQFNATLVMVALIVNALMIGISGNLILSLGLVGALSIVRFRTAVKDPKDTAFIFWAISIGVINGVGYYALSILATAVIGVVTVLLSRPSPIQPSYLLIITHETGGFEPVSKLLKHMTKRFAIRSDSYQANLIEKVIEIRMNHEKREELLQEIRALSGVTRCDLLSGNDEFAE
jgi:uncharacterized membrane protein YhiD involved in acid resistance